MVAGLPGVAAVTRAAAVVGIIEGRDGADGADRGQRVPRRPRARISSVDPIMVDGRLPDSDAADEIAIDELLADRAGVEVGDELTFTTFLSDELEAASDGRDVDPGGEPRRLRVVGVVRGPADLLPPRTSQYALYSDEPYMLLPPAWWRPTVRTSAATAIFMVADLEPGATLEDLSASVADRFGERAFVVPGRGRGRHPVRGAAGGGPSDQLGGTGPAGVRAGGRRRGDAPVRAGHVPAAWRGGR